MVAIAGSRLHGRMPLAREPSGQTAARRFFTSHEAAVVEAATARIAPGPADDPAEVATRVRARPA